MLSKTVEYQSYNMLVFKEIHRWYLFGRLLYTYEMLVEYDKQPGEISPWLGRV